MKPIIIASSLFTIANDTDNVSSVDVTTIASASATLAKACKAFAKRGTDDKRATMASIASAARLTESDACMLVRESHKDSATRKGLRLLRASIVQRVRAASVMHDATDDAASIVKLDRIVSAMDVIHAHAACIVRVVHMCAEPVEPATV